MSRVIISNSSQYADAAVTALVRFAVGDREVGHTYVRVTNYHRAYRGTAYQRPTRARRRHTKAEHYVIVRIGASEHFPMVSQYPGLLTAPEYTMRTWHEALVAVAAHEFTHVTQFRQGAACSEIEAERSAVFTLERYRAEGAEVLLSLVPGIVGVPRRVLGELLRDGIASADARTAEVLARNGLAEVVHPHTWDARRVVLRPGRGGFVGVSENRT